MNTNQTEPNLQTVLLQDLIQEKRRDRLWKNIRFFIWIGLILLLVGLIFSSSSEPMMAGDGKQSGYVALLRLNGDIDAGRDFSSDFVLPQLAQMFRDKEAKGIILDINSGGGSPVQASIIHDAILELKKKYHKKVVVVGEDVMASGAYYVAVAADKIYVNPNTLTGSIGAVMKGFGFNDVMKKIGIERRVYTSGSAKDRLDPFLPQSVADVEKIKSVVDEIHQNFDQAVVEGRQGKLHATESELFTGDFWSGVAAVKLGLVDELGNFSDVLHKEFQVTHYKDYSRTQSMFKSLLDQFSASMSLALADKKVQVVEKL